MADHASADAQALRFIQRFRSCIRFALNRQGLPFHLRKAAEQDITIRILQCFRRGAIDTDRTEKVLRDWVIITSRRVAIDCMSKEQRQYRNGAAGDSAHGTMASPDELVRRNDAQKRLSEAVERLTPVQRLIMRKAIGGLGPVEIAREEQMPLASVKTILHRSRVHLRRLLGGLVVLVGIQAHGQWIEDSIRMDVRELRQSVHQHRHINAPDAFALDSLSYQVITRTIDRLYRLSLPCAQPCVYEFSEWGPCIGGLQTRSLRGRSPPDCGGWPFTERPCRQ
jgi:DNA-directed RNA polymerase specialized sigma24 family protein